MNKRFFRTFDKVLTLDNEKKNKFFFCSVPA